jgi:hypothetical protein
MSITGDLRPNRPGRSNGSLTISFAPIGRNVVLGDEAAASVGVIPST